MIERREQLRLALESRDAIRIAGEEGGEDLDRDVAAQARVARPIHFAHAARADGGNNLGRAESGAWCEGHCDGRKHADYRANRGRQPVAEKGY